MRILVGMSGGLDSSYTLNILKNEGHDLEGAVLVMHDYTDVTAAQKSADEAGIKLNIIDCREAFEREVVSDFLSEYTHGRTPNPCTVCNRKVKFEYLHTFAAENGFERIATGHYAGVGFNEENGRYYIRAGADKRKDQSYMLWNLTQEQLSVLTLPLYKLEKTDVRVRARENGISASEKAESQDICFIADGDYGAFIKRRGIAAEPGDFVDKDGKVIGRHRGIIHYTIGQRRGLGVSAGERLFVSAIDPEHNTITLLPGSGGVCRQAEVTSLNFQKAAPFKAENGTSVLKLRLFVKVRYSAPPIPCVLSLSADSGYTGGIRGIIEFSEEIKAVTPGQSAVFYDGDACGDIVAGGIIV